MRTKIFSLALITLLSVNLLQAQTNTGKTPAGSWKFEAPMAPEGYSTGKIDVTLADNKYSLSVIFSGDYKIPGDQVKFGDNTLTCSVYVEGENVRISLKMNPDDKMTGTADYSQGQIPLTLTRIAANKK